MTPPQTVFLLLLSVLVAMSSGCIALEKEVDPDPVEYPWSVTPQDPPDGMTSPPASMSFVSDSGNVVVPVDPVPVQPGELLPNPNPHNVTSVPLTRIDTTRPVAETTKVFEDHYTLYHSARGLQVDVVDVPFVITFTVTPRNPKPDLNSRLVVTVRDPETLRLVADDGYNGIYGNEPEKSIKLYRAGRYIVTLDGRFVDVTVRMRTEQTTVPG